MGFLKEKLLNEVNKVAAKLDQGLLQPQDESSNPAGLIVGTSGQPLEGGNLKKYAKQVNISSKDAKEIQSNAETSRIFNF